MNMIKKIVKSISLPYLILPYPFTALNRRLSFYFLKVRAARITDRSNREVIRWRERRFMIAGKRKKSRKKEKREV
jgi:hypothetical protein